MWLPPLALYLLTFILAFQGAWHPLRQSMLRLVLVAVASMAYVLRDIRTQLPIAVSVPLFLIALFVICFFLHGELYARRPVTAGMTRFYLVAAAGSAAGTLLVGVIAAPGPAGELRSGLHPGGGRPDRPGGDMA